VGAAQNRAAEHARQRAAIEEERHPKHQEAVRAEHLATAAQAAERLASECHLAKATEEGGSAPAPQRTSVRRTEERRRSDADRCGVLPSTTIGAGYIPAIAGGTRPSVEAGGAAARRRAVNRINASLMRRVTRRAHS
jgi:hypothetical protein